MSFELPPAFADRMRAQLGEEAEAYFAALEMPYLRGLRLNPEKPVSDAALEAVGGVEDPVPWYPALGRYLHRDSAAGADPLHEAGAYYLQEPSAMAPVSALVPKPGERVLDLCAAPGGKSTQIAAALAGEGLLVCNEPMPSRAKILSRNIERMGVTNALVVSTQPEALAARWAGAFDAVLVDAPCSGEGMFRRHPETRAEWTAAAPAGCAERQRRILACAATMLRPGGRLVYSTCTLSPEENEETMRWFLRDHSGFSACPFALPGGDSALDARRGCCASIHTAYAAKDIFWPACAARGMRPQRTCSARRRNGFRRLRPPCAPPMTPLPGLFAACRPLTPSWATRCSPRPICRRWTACACCARACSWVR